jgi:hypothetical protein
MAKTLAEHLQRVIETLAVGESQAAMAQTMMRENHIFLGLEYGYIVEDIARLTAKVRYIKLLAEHLNRASRN